MKTLYLDCGMGAAGDMLMAALWEILPDAQAKEQFIRDLNEAGIPKVTVTAKADTKCGIVGTHMEVICDGQEEQSHDEHDHEHHHEHEHDHDHDHHHDHEHHHDHHHDHEHHHASMGEISHIIEHLQVSEKVKEDVRAIYGLVAQAEAQVHGKQVSEIHFHEVGMMDALADITGCAMLMERLQPREVIASPINVGFGKVRCAHGILPVPAPATAAILLGVPSYAGRIEGELCTPTGAAILKYYTTKFAQMPVMVTERNGYGTGKKDFPAANVVRTLWGETMAEQTASAAVEKEDFADADSYLKEQKVLELACNIDDMTAEEIGYAMEVLLKEGARDVFTIPVGMKKNRPGILLTVICLEEDKERIAQVIFKHTSTLGIRIHSCERMVLTRKIREAQTPYGRVRCKESSGYGVERSKWEFEDLRRIAEETGESIATVKRNLETEQY